MKKILAFSGSNSSRSINQQLVNLIASKVTESEVTVMDLREYPLPIYSLDIEKGEGIPQAALELKQVFDSYDGFIISLPEHNGSLTAFFKNTIDWLSRLQKGFFEQKPILLLSTSPGRGGAGSALAQGEKLLRSMGGQVVARYSLPSFNHKVKVTEQGIRLLHEEEVRIMEKLLASLEEALNAEKIATEQ